jgi:hypothetical protein
MDPSDFLIQMENTIPWREMIFDLKINAKVIGHNLQNVDAEGLVRLRFLQVWFDIDSVAPNPQLTSHPVLKAFAKTIDEPYETFRSPSYSMFKKILNACYWDKNLIVALTEEWSGCVVDKGTAGQIASAKQEVEASKYQATEFATRWAQTNI